MVARSGGEEEFALQGEGWCGDVQVDDQAERSGPPTVELSAAAAGVGGTKGLDAVGLPKMVRWAHLAMGRHSPVQPAASPTKRGYR
jgi:hypothetical protein